MRVALLVIFCDAMLTISLNFGIYFVFLATLVASTTLASTTSASAASASAASASAASTSVPALTASLIHQFPPVHWVENISIRPNGNIIPIFSVGTGAQLNQINPHTNEVSLIHDFTGVGHSIQSIVEVQKDFFVIQVLNCNLTSLACTKGSGSIWSVDFRPGDCDESSEQGEGAVVIKQITTFPDAGLLNGAAALNDHIVIFPDSILGGVWSLDIDTGEKKWLFGDTSMQPTSSVPTGINGIRIKPGVLYYQNSALGTLNSIPISPIFGTRAGDPVVIARNLSSPDDFEVVINKDGSYAYSAEGTGGPAMGGQVAKIDLKDGAILATVAMPGPTSVRKGWNGKLFVSTVGGLLQYVTGNFTLGGAVWEIGT